MAYTFAIIGGGLTATSMLTHIVQKLDSMGATGRQLSRLFTITVFEKKPILGPGLPHNEHYVMPFHITNMCASDMSVRSDKPADFQDWVDSNLHSLKSIYPEFETALRCGGSCSDDCRHYPRAVMGEYLKSQFRKGVEEAAKLGIMVELHTNSEVTDLTLEDERIVLTVEKAHESSSTVYHADAVLLATGHWFESKAAPHYFPSPWPATELLAGIPEGENIGVIGSSLSGIEVALTLSSDGRFERQPSGNLCFIPSDSPRRLTFYSRNGLLPRVRGRIGSRRNRYLTCTAIRTLIAKSPGRLPLLSVFELLDRELNDAYGTSPNWQHIISPVGTAIETLRQDILLAQNGDGPEGELVWQTLLVQIFPVVRELYYNLSLGERERFDRFFSTVFFMHAATQPIDNAQKLLALMEAGIVSIVRLGTDYRFDRNRRNGKYEFVYTDVQGNSRKDAYTYVVNARGQPRSIESDPAALTKNLLKKGLVQIEEQQITSEGDLFCYKTGTVLVDPETHQVIQPDCSPQSSPPLFAIGAMTRGQVIDASMAFGIARSTAAVAEEVTARLLHHAA